MDKEKAICKACGKCCEAIWISSSMSDIHRAAKTGGDALFIVRHWKPISVKEARRKNAFYVEKIVTIYIQEGLLRPPGTWFSCRKFNHRSRLCRVHWHKPRICAQYPFYGKDNTDAVLFSMDCGYRAAQTAKAKELQER